MLRLVLLHRGKLFFEVVNVGSAAKEGGVWFVDLNRTISDRYDAMGPEKVRAYFPFDSTHTNFAGAQLNAQCVIDGMKAAKCPLGFWARVWKK